MFITLILLFSISAISASSNTSSTMSDNNDSAIVEQANMANINTTHTNTSNVKKNSNSKISDNKTVESVKTLSNNSVLANTTENNYSIIYVNANLSSSEIQSIIDNASKGSYLIFEGTYYQDIHLVIDKPLNLISNVGTTLDSYSKKPVFTIKNVNGPILIQGFNILNQVGNGILLNNVSNITISHNKISTANYGIESINCKYLYVKYNNITNNQNGLAIALNNHTYIFNNTFKGNDNGLVLSKSDNTRIYYNTFTGNDNGIYGTSTMDGIYYASGPKNLYIFGNTITNNNGDGIYLESAGDGINIKNNTISNNKGNGIVLDEVGNNVIQSNVVRSNKYSGIKFASNYIAPKSQDISSNALVGNGFREVDARETIYDEYSGNQLVIGANWFGTNDRRSANICPKIRAGFITFGVKQLGNYKGSITFYNPDGTVNNNLPSMTFSVKVANGRAKTYVSNSGTTTFNFDGSPNDLIKVMVDRDTQQFNYVYDSTEKDDTTYDPDHVRNQSEVDENWNQDHNSNSGNGTSNNNNNNGNSNGNSQSGNGTSNSNGNGGSGTNSQQGVSGSSNGLNGLIGFSSVAAAVASSQTSSNSQDDAESSSDGASESSQGQSSQSESAASQVSKYIDLDQNSFTRLAGELFLILIIILSVYGYYRNSIKTGRY